MDSLEDLQRRITDAFQRIENTAKLAAVAVSAIPSDPMRKLAEANVVLASELDSLRAQRSAQAAQLDVWIQKLKPLLNETANA